MRPVRIANHSQLLRRLLMNRWATIGIGIALIAIGLLVRHQGQLHDGEVTIEGRVADVRIDETVERIDGEERVTTRTSVTVEYTVDGSTYRIGSPTQIGGTPRVGDSAEVAYRPINPGDGRVLHRSLDTIGTVAALVGVVLAVVGGVRLASRRTRTTSPGTRRDAPAPAAAPAGWYRDPANGHAERWWDGASWTDHGSDAPTATR